MGKLLSLIPRSYYFSQGRCKKIGLATYKNDLLMKATLLLITRSSWYNECSACNPGSDMLE